MKSRLQIRSFEIVDGRRMSVQHLSSTSKPKAKCELKMGRFRLEHTHIVASGATFTFDKTRKSYLGIDNC